MNTLTTLGLFVSALYAFQNFLRYARVRDWNGMLGILIAAGSGIGVVALAAHADVTSGLHLFGGQPPVHPALGAMDWASQVLLGIQVGSSGTVLADLRNAFDNSTSAVKPLLVAVPDHREAVAA